MDNEEGGGGTPIDPPSLPIRTETLICEICIEPIIIRENQIKLMNPNKCDHPFCSNCVIKYIQAKLEEYNIAQIRCPALDCNEFFEPLTYRDLIGPQTFIRWCDVLCESTLMNLKKSYCPNKDCSALIIDECGSTTGIGRKPPVMKTNCPDCKQLFCFECMKPWHFGFSCNEADRFMKDPNDRAFGVLAETSQWQRCPACRSYVERFEGCSSVPCRCGVRFCYKCGKQLGARYLCQCEGAYGIICNIFCCFTFVIILGCPLLLILLILRY